MSVTPPGKPSLFFIKYAPQLPAVPPQFLMKHALLDLVKNLISDLA